MREKRAVRNVITNITMQLILALSGLVLPRLIMHFYGSAINGMVSSISQFITYAALIELGIGNASIVALYYPLAGKDDEEISSIVTSSARMYRISGYIYSGILLSIAFGYSFLYRNQMAYWFIFELVLCIGAINVIDYFFLSKYKILLTADQKYYILNVARIVTVAIATVGSIFFLVKGKSVVWVKGFAVCMHVCEGMIIACYVRKKYPAITFHSRKIKKIEQRWNALIHQLCLTIVYNTDIVVLTIFLPSHSLHEISVYSVYSMVLNLVTNMGSTLVTGISASFGNMFAKGEREEMRRVFDIYEFCYFIVLFVLYSCFFVLILPFVSCYTKGMLDVNYIRLSAGVLFGLNGLAAQIKDVSGTIINAAGRYKETQRYGIEEATINIVISIILVRQYGITGVLIGTLISLVWMDLCYMAYMCKNLIVNTGKITVGRIIRNLSILVILTVVEIKFVSIPENIGVWIVEAFVVFVINGSVIVGINLFVEKENVFIILGLLHRILRRINGK